MTNTPPANTVNMVHKLDHGFCVALGHLKIVSRQYTAIAPERKFLYLERRICRSLKHVYHDTHLAQKPTVTGKNHAPVSLCSSGHGVPGLYRDSFPDLPGQLPGRLLRQVTFTHHIAVPL